MEPKNPVFGCTWIVTAPWAHPLWQQYALLLYDLTTPNGRDPATLYRPDVTHEMLVYALDPAVKVDAKVEPYPGETVVELNPLPRMLSPANFGYQFTASSDGAAQARLQQLVDEIYGQALSPATDWAGEWDRIFADGVSLKNR